MKRAIKDFLKQHVPFVVLVKRKLDKLQYLLSNKQVFADYIKKNNLVAKKIVALSNEIKEKLEQRELDRLVFTQIVPKFESIDSILKRQISKLGQNNAEVEPHILLFTDTLGPGGAERQWAYLARELSVRGYKTTLLVERLDGVNGHYLYLLSGSAVNIHCLETMYCPQGASSVDTLAFQWSIPKIVQALQFLKPTHVLCQRDMPNILGGMAVATSGIPIQKLLFSFRSLSPEHFDVKLAEFSKSYYRFFLDNPAVVLSCNSHSSIEDYAKWLKISPSRIIHINNACDCDFLAEEFSRDEFCTRFKISPNSLLVLGIFRLSEEKNPFLFLETISKIKQTIPNVVVLHVGTGKLHSEFTELAKKLDVFDNIIMLGRQNNVTSLMKISDIVLQTSRIEGQSNVLLEAQINGVPVVATNVGGTDEVVVDGITGFLAPSEDADTLSKYCIELLNDSQKRKTMGNASKEFVVNTFAIDSMVDSTLCALDLPKIV